MSNVKISTTLDDLYFTEGQIKEKRQGSKNGHNLR